MRRLLILAVLVPACCWLFWASCQSDDYRDTLPLRSFDAAPREGGAPVKSDLAVVVDLARGDQGGVLDGGSDAGVMDAGVMDGGAMDAGVMDAAPGG